MADKEKPKDVEEIVKAYLEANDFDGLCRDECGCGGSDLFPCDFEGVEHCVPAYRHKCSICKEGCADRKCQTNNWFEDEGGCYKPTKQELEEANGSH